MTDTYKFRCPKCNGHYLNKRAMLEATWLVITPCKSVSTAALQLKVADEKDSMTVEEVESLYYCCEECDSQWGGLAELLEAGAIVNAKGLAVDAEGDVKG